MRRSFPRAAVVALVAVVLAPALAAEVTRTLKIEVPPAAARFAIENLAGAMRISSGPGDTVVAVATVHAESEDLAALVRFEKVADATRPDTFRVRYPYEKSTSFRYPGSGKGESHQGWLDSFVGSGTTTKYDGHKVKVSGGSGLLVYADLEIQLPRRAVDGAFRNLVGPLHATGVEGKLQFDTGSGKINLEEVKGEIKSDAGSGDVKATNLEGSFACGTGSGDCILDGFRGDTVSLSVGSGDMRLSSIVAKKLSSDAGSGDLTAVDIDVEEIDTDAGSGNVEITAKSARLARVKSDAGSGDLTLRLGPDASFDAHVEQGSGEIVNRYADAQPIVQGKEVIGYRRGTGRTRIDFEAGSGDLVLEPGTL